MRHALRSPGDLTTDTGTDQLIDALTQLSRKQRVVSERVARELGWPRAGLGVLRVLSSGPASLSDVAAALEVDASVASRQVGALADAGYVARSVDATDRRIRTIEITDSGRALAVRAKEQFARTAARAFSTWSDDDLASAVTQLRRLGEAIGSAVDTTTHQHVTRN
ncbi:MarR family winged helix-turn-helix transcriptional regulator [Myceligenerans salitolerans]|uniref:Winged helix DNA-binding protein n=1 Tax=Myceligenerans salitolerans TaxID=1230528 RepID=A0ABS3IC62_9MICO|nr:MarR family transcriptional regulator [Myceligenerans salitolerans]MBO0609647.1 winged helix DNA-binding protein [Myceligenerans salitolerans]